MENKIGETRGLVVTEDDNLIEGNKNWITDKNDDGFVWEILSNGKFCCWRKPENLGIKLKKFVRENYSCKLGGI